MVRWCPYHCQKEDHRMVAECRPLIDVLAELSHRLGRTLGQRAVADKTDEITQIVPLLQGLACDLTPSSGAVGWAARSGPDAAPCRHVYECDRGAAHARAAQSSRARAA